eukprot:TRINITY_DN31058_c0_g1_i1.p1 TRINITY_DN31058_c0_g1~~TRINITY_DN31058_c0_g1_i1.p1  ORF type:complete len:220 (-),score=49.56 TRINITY_DN31058_c0_g1_i1:99-758(-)
MRVWSAPMAESAADEEALRKRWLDVLCDFSPLLTAFHESGFQAEVSEFVRQRAPDFLVVCSDGSQPLVWTTYHEEYRDIFERQLQAVLLSHNLSNTDVIGFVSFLRDCRGVIESGEIFDDFGAGDVDWFIRSVTSSEDYDTFLGVMFEEVQRQYAQLQQPNSSTLDVAAQVHEIDVTVPDGMQAGQAVAIEYLGQRYELSVPEGYSVGMTFRAAVAIAS